MPEPERTLVLGVFLREQDLVAAARATRSAGHRIHDAFTPYAVHGLDQAMGLPPSRLPRLCFALALGGLLLAGFGQFWISAVDWPLDVGGKPFNSLPAFLPGMFEVMVLLSGVGTVLAVFWRSGLRPGKQAWLAHAQASDDRFVLAVEAGAPAARALATLWQRFDPSEVLTVPEVGPS